MTTNFKKSGEFNPKINKIAGSNVILDGRGVSWFCNPAILFSLKRFEGITTTDVLVAMAMFEHSANSRCYPSFQVSHKTIAEKCFLSRRQVILSVQRLTLLRLFSCVSQYKDENLYQWNEYFLSTGDLSGAKVSLHEVKDFHQTSETLSLELVKDLHPLYIDFILNSILNFYKDFFSEHNKTYTFYVPSKRTKKDSPQGSGETISVSRIDAWKDAIDVVSKELIKKGLDGYVRIYLALMSGLPIQKVDFPKAYLRNVSLNENIQWKSMNKSEIQFYLDNDESFKNYIHIKSGHNLEEVQ